MKQFVLLLMALCGITLLNAQQESAVKKLSDTKSVTTIHYLSVYNTGVQYTLVQAPFGKLKLEESIIKPMVLAKDYIEVEVNEVPDNHKSIDMDILKKRAQKISEESVMLTDGTRAKSKQSKNTDIAELKAYNQLEIASLRTCVLQTDNMKDNIALIAYDKDCDMSFKCLQAQRAGAILAIVVHNTNNKDSLILPKGRYADSLKIACFSITQSQGDSIKSMLPSFVGISKPQIKSDITDSTQVKHVDSLKLDKSSKLGIDDAAITLSPNPSNDVVYITYLLPSDNDAKLEVVNSLGQAIQSKTIRGSTSGTFELDTLPWVNGVYIVELRYGNKKISQKLIVQH